MISMTVVGLFSLSCFNSKTNPIIRLINQTDQICIYIYTHINTWGILICCVVRFGPGENTIKYCKICSFLKNSPGPPLLWGLLRNKWETTTYIYIYIFGRSACNYSNYNYSKNLQRFTQPAVCEMSFSPRKKKPHLLIDRLPNTTHSYIFVYHPTLGWLRYDGQKNVSIHLRLPSAIRKCIESSGHVTYWTWLPSPEMYCYKCICHRGYHPKYID